MAIKRAYILITRVWGRVSEGALNGKIKRSELSREIAVNYTPRKCYHSRSFIRYLWGLSVNVLS